ncbi:MAG: hypothetical protein ACRDWT_20165 [Jatrophihabitantaceae bacterium]
MPAELYLRCPGCNGPRAFEQPPCADGHGADCPERVCVRCGAAILLGPAVPGAVGSLSGSERHAA